MRTWRVIAASSDASLWFLKLRSAEPYGETEGIAAAELLCMLRSSLLPPMPAPHSARLYAAWRGACDAEQGVNSCHQHF